MPSKCTDLLRSYSIVLYHTDFKGYICFSVKHYLGNNRHRMGYAEAIEANYPIGSGVTEATCKTLVTQRMKCAGMRWDINGGQGVLTTRSLIQSENFDHGWKILSGNYIKEVSLPENVVAFKRK